MEIKMIFNIPDLITGIGTIAALVFAIITYIKNNNRQRNQSTIEYYDKISDEVSGPLRVAISKLLKESLANYSYRTIMPNDKIWLKNKKLQKKCFKYFRFMERFAVGIKLRIYDYKTFYNIAGITTVKLFQQIQHLIKENKHSDYQGYISCVEYKKLCGRLLKQMCSKGII